MQQSLCCVPCETCEGLGSIEVMLLGFVFVICYRSNWSAVISDIHYWVLWRLVFHKRRRYFHVDRT